LILRKDKDLAVISLNEDAEQAMIEKANTAN
jgi:hypothetical protein